MHWDINTLISLGAFIVFPVLGAVYKHLRDVARDEIKALEKKILAVQALAEELVRQTRADSEAGKAQVAAALLEQRQSLGKTREELQVEIATNREEHSNFRVYVEKTFVNVRAFEGFEARMREQFQQIDQKLDRLIERNQRRDTP